SGLPRTLEQVQRRAPPQRAQAEVAADEHICGRQRLARNHRCLEPVESAAHGDEGAITPRTLDADADAGGLAVEHEDPPVAPRRRAMASANSWDGTAWRIGAAAGGTGGR